MIFTANIDFRMKKKLYIAHLKMACCNVFVL